MIIISNKGKESVKMLQWIPWGTLALNQCLYLSGELNDIALKETEIWPIAERKEKHFSKRICSRCLIWILFSNRASDFYFNNVITEETL